jgi:hypothetical protein
MKMNANDFQTERQLKVQRFHQLAEQHIGLVIASQLAAEQALAQFAGSTETRNTASPSEPRQVSERKRRAQQ